jgi:hypothetical protein
MTPEPDTEIATLKPENQLVDNARFDKLKNAE